MLIKSRKLNMLSTRSLAAIGLVFVGCCSNVVFLELLIKEDPGSGNIITFSQFVFIAIDGFLFTTKLGTKENIIPLSEYGILVTMFFIVSVVNNYALNFNIAMPLHMIFRSGSLIANMALGFIILKRRYKLSKYLSVFMISMGIVLCTYASGKNIQSSSSGTEAKLYDYMIWSAGIALLTFALFMSARMGIYQETLYASYGKHPAEALFYSHALPLPGFLLLSRDIYNHAVLFTNSAPTQIPLLPLALPKMWLYIIGNVLTQYVCIRSVFTLTTECTSLTVTLVITLRKFVSLIFSIMYFKNPFTIEHWMGTLLVFAGTLMFVDIVSIIREVVVGKAKKTE